MKIIIPGGTGQVGTVLAHEFHEAGHQVVVLGRNPSPAPWRVVQWDAVEQGKWTSEVDGADVVINMAGQSVNCRYNDANRKLIKQSRVKSTEAIGQAIAHSTSPPRLWLQASTATIYSHRYDAPNDEETGILGARPEEPDTWHFSVDVATSWERATNDAPTPRTRKVLLRSAMVGAGSGKGKQISYFPSVA